MTFSGCIQTKGALNLQTKSYSSMVTGPNKYFGHTPIKDIIFKIFNYLFINFIFIIKKSTCLCVCPNPIYLVLWLY